MRWTAAACVTLCLLGQAFGAVIGEPKGPFEDLPTDVARQHVQRITEGSFEYEIEMAGAVDGTMTRTPVGYGAFKQGWQPNRSVLIENVGRRDVRNPWIVVNGRRNWRTPEAIVTEATAGYTADADRARAIWELRRKNRFHACTWDAECSDAVKSLNVYGYTLCGNEARALNDLWKTAGLTTRRCYTIGHVVTEVFYDGRYHLLDSDEHVICLLRDNKTIASATDMVRDHDLIKRTHTYGILHRDDRRRDEFSASLYVHEGEREGDYGANTQHAMELSLRPGESIELRWDHVGKQYSAGRPRAKGQRRRDGLGDLTEWGPTAYDKLCNGKIRYRPDLSDPAAAGGAMNARNAVFDSDSAAIKPVDPAEPAAVPWRFKSPYVFVGGKACATIAAAPVGAAQWHYSTDQESWKPLPSAHNPPSGSIVASIDEVVSPGKQPTYEFWLRLVFEGGTNIKKVHFEHDVQTAPLALPELHLGANRIAYTDSNTGGRQVRVTHRWMERTSWRPPTAPPRALAPRVGQTVEGSRVTFRWTPATDPDGDAIADYHLELSEHEDMRWPLSPNFEKLVSRTVSKGKAEWTVPSVGLLNPETDYFWRVRACDAKSLWGPWSRTFRFRIAAPGVPLDVRLVPTGDGRLMLRWSPNPQGERPVAYRVYGSDERGFSVSDTEYVVFRGKGFVGSMEEYESKPSNAPDAGQVKTPANLIAQTSEASLPVVGPDLAQPNTNRAYYRVVAVDAAGNQSGPSDYAEVPRPFVVNRPDPGAVVGRPYRFEPLVIRSLGDLRVRRSATSSYNAAFWDREEHTFRAIKLPPGLSLAGETGVISGSPAESGEFDLVVEVRDQSGRRCVISRQLTVAAAP